MPIDYWCYREDGRQQEIAAYQGALIRKYTAMGLSERKMSDVIYRKVRRKYGIRNCGL